MSLLKNCIGRTGEDVATETLAYLLSAPAAHVQFQKLFFNRILGKLASAAGLNAEFNTQVSFEKGRPDFVIVTNETLVLGEVKLGSYLSGETQLLAYCDSFSDQKLQEFYVSTSAAATGNKMLLFIAPSTTIGPSLRTTDEHCKSKYGVSFQSHCEHKGIRFQWLTWEEIVSDLDGSDMLQKELQLLVEDFINKELTMEEIKVLANPDIPSSLLKLFGFIQDVKSHLDGNGVRTYRMSQSYNFFGFMLEATGFKGYFGYFLPLWEKHKTPLGLQVREEWIKEGGGKILDSLRDAEFRKEQDHEWVKMFDLQTLPNLKQDLLSTIRQVDKRVA